MKLIIIFFSIFLITSNSYSQLSYTDSDLFLNSNEDARAFTYNPAILGLGHKFNFSLSTFYNAYSKSYTEIDVAAAFGKLGLSYRDMRIPELSSINSQIVLTGLEDMIKYRKKQFYSVNYGTGNKNFSVGMGYEHLSYEGKALYNYLTFGVIYRPKEFISLSGVYKLYSYSKSSFNFYTDNFILGTGVRPIKNIPITLYLNAYNRYIGRRFDLNDFELKAGFTAEVYPGIQLRGYYRDDKDFSKIDNFGLGVSLSLGNIGFATYSDYKRGPVDKYTGTSFFLNYTSEKRESFLNRNKNLEVKLSGSLTDYYVSPVLFGILGVEKKSVHQIINEMDKASDNDRVKGMVLYLDPFTSGGKFGVTATLEEIGNAIQRFRSKNKKVVAYLAEGSGIEEYYVATFADKIVFPREAIVNYALSIDVLNYRDFLQKYGINLEVFAAGKYKLTFQGLQDSVSSEAREVINRAMDVIYDEMLDRVSKGRNVIITEDFKKELSKPLNAYELKEMNLIDEIGWYKDAQDVLKNMTGTDALFYAEKDKWNDSWTVPGEIAVIGVFGGITTGESKAPPVINIPLPYLSQGRTTGSQTVLKQLRDAFANKNVKAVILRVDSGGGSALASAEIYDEIKRLKKKYNKPFIVSMGDAAASGGYYVSAGADKIFSGKTTVTGSIGVFFAMPKLDSLMRSQKIDVETFKRGEYSDIKSLFEPFTEEEREIILKQVYTSYRQFIKSIAEGRKMSVEDVDEVAQGRVWMGSDALRLKLVDEIGGLYQAIQYAKKMSGSDRDENINITFYPVAGSEMIELTTETNSFMENLKKWLGW